MNTNKMYSERAKQGNVPVIRICRFDCGYCAFERFRKMSKCQKCRDNVPHSHLEVLQRTPPKTKPGEFLTVGLSGDVCFMPLDDFWHVVEYCRKWNDRTFLIQSKNPAYFLRFDSFKIPVPDNIILGTTIESNKRDFAPLLYKTDYPHYDYISAAPYPDERYEAMLKLNCRTAIIIEPILDFDIKILEDLILTIQPEFVYIGYANDGKDGKRLRLPEPELQKTHALIDRLRRNCYGTEIRIKTLRPAWHEKTEIESK